MSSSSAVVRLKTVVFMGSSKATSPPWGGDARLGDRVLQWVKKTLDTRRGTLGNSSSSSRTVVVEHEYTVVDPKEVFATGPPPPSSSSSSEYWGALSEISTGELSTPTFFLRTLPPKTQALKDLIASADCYLIVAPEYNHVVSPALASVMGHFGGSCYAAKPSAIVTYSAGPWGGMRAAMTIGSMCHELGCLPVSKLCGIPNASALLQADGSPTDPNDRMLKQLPAMLTQLEWMAVAMKNQRESVGTEGF